MEFYRGEERAVVTETEDGWRVVYMLPGQAIFYATVKSRRRLVRSLQRGGWWHTGRHD